MYLDVLNLCVICLMIVCILKLVQLGIMNCNNSAQQDVENCNFRWRPPYFCWKLPDFYWKPPDFHWRPQDFHWKPTDFYWRPPDFYWKPLDFHWRPPDFYWKPLAIHWKPSDFHWKPPICSFQNLKEEKRTNLHFKIFDLSTREGEGEGGRSLFKEATLL